MALSVIPMFDAAACKCDHPEHAHDDGFGCTAPGCRCLAGWYFPDIGDVSGAVDAAGNVHSDTELDAPGW